MVHDVRKPEGFFGQSFSTGGYPLYQQICQVGTTFQVSTETRRYSQGGSTGTAVPLQIRTTVKSKPQRVILRFAAVYMHLDIAGFPSPMRSNVFGYETPARAYIA